MAGHHAPCVQGVWSIYRGVRRGPERKKKTWGRQTNKQKPVWPCPWALHQIAVATLGRGGGPNAILSGTVLGRHLAFASFRPRQRSGRRMVVTP